MLHAARPFAPALREFSRAVAAFASLRALLNSSSSTSPALVSGGRATVRFCRRTAAFAAPLATALPFLLLFFFPLGHVLFQNMAGRRLDGHPNHYRYRQCGTGKPLHVFFPEMIAKNSPVSGQLYPAIDFLLVFGPESHGCPNFVTPREAKRV
jgi:hypothetical protein